MTIKKFKNFLHQATCKKKYMYIQMCIKVRVKMKINIKIKIKMKMKMKIKIHINNEVVKIKIINFFNKCTFLFSSFNQMIINKNIFFVILFTLKIVTHPNG